MSPNVKNDEEAQFFHDTNMIRDSRIRTSLIGVVDSKSFANTDIDYFVGAGCLAGVMGLSNPTQNASLDAHEKLTKLTSGMGLEEDADMDKSPVFCWIEHFRPEFQSQTQDASWMQMDDVVGPVSSHDTEGEPLYPGIPRAGLAILLKICGALANMGYPTDMVSKVGDLVRKNLMTAVHYGSLPLEVESSPADLDWIGPRVQVLLSSLLDAKSRGKRSVNMNSNEPVLLINTFGTLRHEQIRDIIRTTLQQLQQNWSIWPVRAYAGPFVVGEVDEGYQHHGFSVTLLNVVNTDIGGPSMIDLLDQGCDAPIWSWSLDSFFKETWRDRQLVDRYETGAPLSRSSSSDSISRHSGESQVSDAVEAPVPGPSVEPVSDRVSLEVDDSEVHSLKINVLADVGIDRQEVETEESIKKTPGISDTPKDDESIWDDVRAQYDNQNVGKAIKHPTFEHASGGGSLLDLIRSQAGDADDAGNEAEHEASTGDPSSAERQTACPGDDEFVVV